MLVDGNVYLNKAVVYGNKRNSKNPVAEPFEDIKKGVNRLNFWN
jgi:hypothetical protein